MPFILGHPLWLQRWIYKQSDMENYKIKIPDIAQACINIMKRHPWYHDQRTAIFSIADKELLAEVRESGAKKLFNSNYKKGNGRNCQSNTKIQILLIYHHS